VIEQRVIGAKFLKHMLVFTLFFRRFSHSIYHSFIFYIFSFEHNITTIVGQTDYRIFLICQTGDDRLGANDTICQITL